MRVELEYHYSRLDLELDSKTRDQLVKNQIQTQLESQFLSLNSFQARTKFDSNSNSNSNQARIRTLIELEQSPYVEILEFILYIIKLKKYSLKTQGCTSSFIIKIAKLQPPITSPSFIMNLHPFFRISPPIWNNFTIQYLSFNVGQLH